MKCGMKWLLVFSKYPKTYFENLKETGDIVMITKMKMLKWMSRVTPKYIIRNECTR